MDEVLDGYGGHTTLMNGAELTLMCQEGIVRCHALRWHVSGDVSGRFATNSSIHDTFNRGVSSHATQNIWIEDSAISKTAGHSYCDKGSAKFGNVLESNLGLNSQ
ncbi:MAG: hypothetical protein AB8B62_11335 [Roseobacter sp.]